MTKTLFMQKAAIVKKIPKKRNEIIKGCLVKLKLTCGKKNCKCYTKGEKHTSLYLSKSVNGKTRMIYIPKRYEAKVKEYVKRHKQMQKVIEELSEINIKILKTGTEEK